MQPKETQCNTYLSCLIVMSVCLSKTMPKTKKTTPKSGFFIDNVKKKSYFLIGKQFEILALMAGAKCNCMVNGNDGRAKFYLNNKGIYARILIKKCV
jgi:hypothetical protein